MASTARTFPGNLAPRLAIKFALVTMLRSYEVLGIQRGELNAAEGTVDIPKSQVKSEAHTSNQPLSDLAWQIIKEAMGDNEYAFMGRFGDSAADKRPWRPHSEASRLGAR